MATNNSIEKSIYGTTADGKPVEQYTLTNANGMEVKVITFGGIITSLSVPDRTGKMNNIVSDSISWRIMKREARISAH